MRQAPAMCGPTDIGIAVHADGAGWVAPGVVLRVREPYGFPVNGNRGGATIASGEDTGASRSSTHGLVIIARWVRRVRIRCRTTHGTAPDRSGNRWRCPHPHGHDGSDSGPRGARQTRPAPARTHQGRLPNHGRRPFLPASSAVLNTVRIPKSGADVLSQASLVTVLVEPVLLGTREFT